MKQQKKKKIKQRNFIFLAMIKRNGSGVHNKTNKAKRKNDKQKELDYDI